MSLIRPPDRAFRLAKRNSICRLIGEFNVRNAAMAISAARFYGVSLEEIQKALASFQGIARRQEVRGRSARGEGDRRFRTSSDRDPRNVARVATSLSRVSFVGRLRAALEHDAPRGFSAGASRCAETGGRRFHFASRAPRANPGSDRLNPEAVVEAIAASGRPAFYEPDVAHIVERLVPLLKPQDVVVIFSNGGFDGIHEKLLDCAR